ncbi:MAG TPA: flagellin [Fimbriimonadaceae bacterium]|nr:flagellin [Fimbriimonadaceae bacterium]
MRINTNVPAMSALRSLDHSQGELAGVLQRLSTGLRINSAADDPAGLIISEGMRAQMRGLEQAVKNSQDAVNMVKTAEGALDEVQRLLRDIRALAVHSANSAVVDANVVQANQTQIVSTLQSIDRIANSTQFGNKKLLDGSAGTYATSTSPNNVANLFFGGTFNNNSITTNSTVTLVMTQAASQGSVAATRTFATAATTVPAGSFTINGRTFTTRASDTIQDVLDQINAASGITGVTASWTAGGAVTLTTIKYGSDQVVNFSDTNGVLLTAPGSPAPGVGVDATADVVIDMNGSAAGGLTTVAFTAGKGLQLRDNNGNVINLTSAGNALGAPTAIGNITSGTAQFQIGAYDNQAVAFALPVVFANQLGTSAISGQSLADIDVTTQSGAQAAMRIIDDAISQLAQMRGRLGSFQKDFLQSTVRSLNVANENLAASESQIRDAEMAGEMTNFTRLQILQQSGTAMLAQANQLPTSVLSLLQQ